jgi:hypothetical protein
LFYLQTWEWTLTKFAVPVSWLYYTCWWLKFPIHPVFKLALTQVHVVARADPFHRR